MSWFFFGKISASGRFLCLVADRRDNCWLSDIDRYFTMLTGLLACTPHPCCAFWSCFWRQKWNAPKKADGRTHLVGQWLLTCSRLATWNFLEIQRKNWTGRHNQRRWRHPRRPMSTKGNMQIIVKFLVAEIGRRAEYFCLLLDEWPCHRRRGMSLSSLGVSCVG